MVWDKMLKALGGRSCNHVVESASGSGAGRFVEVRKFGINYALFMRMISLFQAMMR